MGKKAKTGKARRDKAYWSAKEIGYRSRASFKLIQLNRKFEFLQKSRVCIDLCAAPGSWMQVAKEHMPMSSLIVGVDLAPIKPIPGCINLMGDITTDKCRSDLKKELQTWKADLVLNDGAPNVGKSWVHDAYNQSLLTLAAFKLGTEFLVKGGHFVTKIFRSKDYQSLVWLFNQFFRRVHATKPAASRHESAEIFVVCLGYKAPDKIDPKFLDAKFVFSDVDADASQEAQEDREVINPEKKRKAPAEGYAEGTTLLFKQAKASEFVLGDKPIHLLNNCYEIVVDEARIRKHKATTQEIVECCRDIKVLGVKELRLLKKWRQTLRTDFEQQQEEEAKKEAEGDVDEEREEEEEEDEEEEDEDLKMLEDEIDTLQDEERRAAKRQKKKKQKEKQKLAQRINLKMVLPGDEGPTRQEDGLFSLTKAIKDGRDVRAVTDQAPDVVADGDSADEETKAKAKYEMYDRNLKLLDKSGLYYKDEESEEEDEEEDDSDREDLGLDHDSAHGSDDDDDEKIDELNDPPKNPLLVEMGARDRKSRKEKRADVWFDKDVFKGIDDDDDLEEADVEAAIAAVKNEGGKVPSKPKPTQPRAKKPPKREAAEVPQQAADSGSDSDDDDSDSDYDEEEFYPYRGQHQKPGAAGPKENGGFEVVPVQKAKKRPGLNPEELALGQELVSSRKRRRELEDAAWNRYMFEDRDKDLPDWFVKEEQYHMRPRPEADPETVQYYKDRQNDVGVKTIKKVVEAKARKKRKVAKKMDRARKRAATILEDEDLGSREKAREVQRLYKRAASASNDNFRDLYLENKPEWKKIIEERVLMYSFVDDMFMPPDDPHGRNGPHIDELLSFGSSSKTRVCHYGRHCTYGRNCKYAHPERESENILRDTPSNAPRPYSEPVPRTDAMCEDFKRLSLPDLNRSQPPPIIARSRHTSPQLPPALPSRRPTQQHHAPPLPPRSNGIHCGMRTTNESPYAPLPVHVEQAQMMYLARQQQQPRLPPRRNRNYDALPFTHPVIPIPPHAQNHQYYNLPPPPGAYIPNGNLNRRGRGGPYDNLPPNGQMPVYPPRNHAIYQTQQNYYRSRAPPAEDSSDEDMPMVLEDKQGELNAQLVESEHLRGISKRIQCRENGTESRMQAMVNVA